MPGRVRALVFRRPLLYGSVAVHRDRHGIDKKLESRRDDEHLDTWTAVNRDPERVTGAWVFRGTRVPVSALFENLRGGAMIDQFLEWFPGVERHQLLSVLDHEREALMESARS